MKKIVLTMLLCVGVLLGYAQKPLPKSDFTDGYTTGDDLEKAVYSSLNQDATNPIQIQWNGKYTSPMVGASPVVVEALSYLGYGGADGSLAIQLARLASGDRFSLYSLSNNSADYPFPGAYYVAFMVKVEEVASSGGADFFALDGNYAGNNTRGRIFVTNGSSSSYFTFGLSDQGSTPDATAISGDYSKGNTFLLVYRYETVSNTEGILKLYVNPDPSESEPATPTVQTNATAPIATGAGLRSINIRQRSTTKLQIGGIRLAKTWADAVAYVSQGTEATLTLQQPLEGGSLAANPVKTPYDINDVVTITATPADGYILKTFVVNGVNTPATSENTLELTMDEDKTVTAVFENSLITRDFLVGYTVGDYLEKGSYANTNQDATSPIQINQWNLSGKAGLADQGGTNPPTVAPLTYSGYIESGKDVAINLLKTPSGENRTSIYSLASDNTYAPGTYYVAFMFNASTASTTSGNEFISLDGNYTGNAQRARFGIKGIDATTFAVGLGDSGAPTTFNGTFNYGQTYLAVMKVTFSVDASNNSTGNTWVYINPDITQSEPLAAFATLPIASNTALRAIKGLVVRQRSTQALQVGGIRFATTWVAAATSASTITGINNPNVGKGEIISEKYYTLTGIEVSQSTTGLLIKKVVYDNGVVEATKIFKK